MSEFVVMKNVKKTYKMGEVMIHAVDGVDIEIHKGEFAVIVGPSGAGKTTVLNMLGGMDRVTSGKVIVLLQLMKSAWKSLLLRAKSAI